MLIISLTDIQNALSMEEAISVQSSIFENLYQGKAIMPLRSSIQTDYGVSLFMPSFILDSNVLGIKVVSIRMGNSKNRLPTIPAYTFLLDGVTGAPLALMDGTYLTCLRTAAGSAVATKLMAREEVTKLVVFGAGQQAKFHVYAMLAVRPSLKEIVIVNRTKSTADLLVNQLRSDKKLSSLKIVASESAEPAIQDADIIVTATNTNDPLFNGNHIKKGAHINCIGSYLPTMQEVDTTTIKRSLVVVDTKEGVLSESGDLIIPIKQKIIDPSHVIAELGEVVHGKKIRKHPKDITLFKSCGIAVQDVAIAHAVYLKAKEKKLGTTARL